jgi:hypothetical protein
MTGFNEFFGVLSTAMIFVSRVFYFRGIFLHGAKPHAFSWLIWACISSVGFAAQVAEGAGPGAWARGFAASTCYLLAWIGYIRGDRSYTRSDWIILFVSLLAIPLWIVTKTPLWSVILVCIIDTVGFIPTIRKSWDRPREEPASGYACFTLGALFSIFAIETYTPSTWLYPVAMVFTNCSMTAYLLIRRAKTGPAALA